MMTDSANHGAIPPSPAVQQIWWHKPLIWGGFLALLYLLREFFLIGFLTFLLCFVVRSLIGMLTRRISPNRESRGLELVLTLSIFLAVCLVLYTIGRYFVPPLIRQARSLVVQLQNTSAEDVQNSVLSSSVGAWEFHQQYGAPDDPRYQKAFKQFQASERNGEGLYNTFPKLNSRLQAEFEAEYEQAQLLHLQSEGLQAIAGNPQFEQWIFQVKAAELFQDNTDYYITRWEAEIAAPDKSRELAALKQQPEFESIRNEQIRRQILDDIKSDPVRLAQLENQWGGAQSIRQWREFRNSPEYQQQFKTFYEKKRQENPASTPIEYSFFRSLAAAYPLGKQTFLSAVRKHYQNENESIAHQQHDFETATKLELGRKWWANSHQADWIRDHAKNDGPQVLEAVVARLERGLGHLMRVPIQVATALVLSILILIEWHGLQHGVQNIRQTRLRPIYDEVVPGIVALGKLIGRSFQGQTIIALFNAFFTLVAMWLIGVEYKFILTLIVFVFSFVPTIGVILSGIPICAVALLQPGGSLLMVLQVIAAIVVIHLIEGMVLAPRIIGKIGHLHPVMVIAILLVAEHFFGMWGLILGIPVAIYLIRVVLLKSPIPGVFEPDVGAA